MRGTASSSARVNDDTSLSLGNLRRRTGKPLLHSVVDIFQVRKIPNDKSIQFWEDLKCYGPQEPNTKAGCQDSRLSDRIALELQSPRKGFVALSYCWKPSAGESNKTQKYRMASRMEEPLEVRDIVLHRTFRFIRYKQTRGVMLPLWIDQLSIDQEDIPEKEIAMQSMDLVYKNCTYVVGYLWTQFQTQTEMNRLSELLNGRIVGRKLVEGKVVLIRGIDNKAMREVLDLLTIITNDVWWTRAWIYQEDYLAGRRMWLMIRHSNQLRKPPVHNKLGLLRGEVVVDSNELKTYATLFCLACFETIGHDSEIFKQSTKILDKVAKYNILYKYQYGKGINVGKSMTISILTDLRKRQMRYRTDILPIVANVCSYDIRLATMKDDFKTQSLSMSILALYVANGELLADCPGADELKNDVLGFLRTNALYIRAPLPDGELTLIKHCRLSVHNLSAAGVHTRGMLWRLGDIISPKRFLGGLLTTTECSHQRDLFRNGLDGYRKGRLSELLRFLDKQRKCNKRRYQSITEDLEAYLKCTGPSSTHDDWPPQHSMNVMASSIVDAMDTGKYIQLARPVGNSLDSGRGVPYRALLVRDRNDLHSLGATYVFTSWSRTSRHRKGITETRKLAKYVSLVVDVGKDVESGPAMLKSNKWINGLCFFDGEEKSPFVFKWPDSLSQ
jgi:hypothetical protein